MKIVIISALVALSIAAPQYGYAPPALRTTPPPPPPPPTTPAQTYIAPAPAYSVPAPSYGAPAASNRVAVEVSRPVAILRDDRTQDEFGSFRVDFEAENGIVFSQSGSADGPEGSVVKSGGYSYTAPDGTFVEVTYVADENGFQPQSDLLPVAPEFPHPIPQFVLDQITFAAEEDAAAARAAASAPANSYAAPPTASVEAPRSGYGYPQ